MKQKGFTIIELIVVIAIIAVLAAILAANFPAINLQFALSRSAYKFTQDARRAMEVGFSANQQSGLISASKGSNSYTVSVIGPSGVESINTEKGIKIVDIKIDGTSVDSTTVCFQAPNPNITIMSGTGSCPPPANYNSGKELNVIFEIESDSSKTKTVTINKFGLIETK